MKFIDQLGSIVTKDSNIIGKEKYLNSAVLIPIVMIDDKEFILFQKRSQTVRQPGEVSFPGGHFDPLTDSDFLETAVRETCEELGILSSKIKVVGKLGTLIAPIGVIVEAYLGILKINSLEELNIDKKEVEKVFLIPLDYFVNNQPDEYFTRLEIHPHITNEDGEKVILFPIKELGLPDKYSTSWTKRKHRVLVYHATEEIIWGITAELIYELSQKLKGNIDK